MEVIIEVATPPGAERPNCPLYCAPLGSHLIGRIRVADNPIPVHEDLQALPEIPGHRVSLDVKKRRVRVYHPLADPKMADRLEKIQAHQKREFGSERSPPREIVLENMTDAATREWAQWLEACVAGKLVTLLQGELPPPELRDAESKQPVA